VNNYTALRGNHSFKAGINLQWIHDKRGTALPVSYTFPNVQAYLDARSGVNPRGYTTFSQTLGTRTSRWTTRRRAWFIQDDWRLTSNLKVLYGIRHDLYLYNEGIPGSPYSETFNRDYNNIAPRAGFAWTLERPHRHSGQLRHQLRSAAAGDRRARLRQFRTRGPHDQLLAEPDQPLRPGLPGQPERAAANGGAGVEHGRGHGRGLRVAKTWQNNVTSSGSSGAAMRCRSACATRAATTCRSSPTSTWWASRRCAVSRTAAGSTRRPSTRIPATIRGTTASGWSSPSATPGIAAFTIGLNKRWSSGIQYNLNYSLGKGEDTAPLGGNVLAIQGDAPRSDPNDLARDKGPNQLDIRHTFNGSIVGMSSVKRFGPFINALLSDHQLGIILLVNSGQPDGIAGTRDLNFDGFGGDRPLFMTRNNMTAPIRSNVDLRYSRFFGVGGNRRVELQVETKNLFNQEQVSAVNNTVTVDVDGHPVDPVTLVRLPVSIDLDQRGRLRRQRLARAAQGADRAEVLLLKPRAARGVTRTRDRGNRTGVPFSRRAPLPRPS
jgi:hypothetical protein